MIIDPLTAVSPLDGRYHAKVNPLAAYFSEYALIQYRIMVQVAWLKALAKESAITEIPAFSSYAIHFLDALVSKFSVADAAEVKEIEGRTNHDVKAVELWIKQKIWNITDLGAAREFVHFACTSEDINNLAYTRMLKDACGKVMLPMLDGIFARLRELAHQHADVPMMSRTHGQPATPTTMGKEIANVVHRLRGARKLIAGVELSGKINGAVGNYNAHLVAYPGIDWHWFAQRVVNNLGLPFNPYTTQIEPHDAMAELFDAFARANTILIDWDRDVWGYVSLGYFKQKMKPGEVGSSTMPHKVNPIDFENSEGNLGMANAMLRHLSDKLPISRWQRDLTDSTVLRNMGVALGYTLLGWDSCLRGIGKLEVDAERMATDLNEHWELLAEPIQTVMRRHGLAGGYDQLKDLTRGQSGHAMRMAIVDFINELDLPRDEKLALQELRPATYIGLAAKLARQV